MDRTKKQHYISQSILKEFFQTDKIKEYNLNENKNYFTSVGNSMCCSDIYECDLYEDNKLEDVFSVLYDGQFASILKSIKEELNNGCIVEANNILLKSFYFYTISYYKSLASLIRLSINDKNKLDKNISTKKMFALITDIKYIKQISLIFSNCYKVFFIKSVNSNFILCDQFISTASNYFNGMFSNISNRDIGIRGSMIFLPISRDYYVLLGDKNFDFGFNENQLNKLSIVETEKVNNIIYNNATEKVVTTRNDDYNFYNINSFGDESCYMVYKNGTKAWKKKKELFYSDYEQSIYEIFMNFEWVKGKNLRRNDKCYCGSKIKYKNCCYDKVNRCSTIMKNIENKSLNNLVAINNLLGIEKNIEL